VAVEDRRIERCYHRLYWSWAVRSTCGENRRGGLRFGAQPRPVAIVTDARLADARPLIGGIRIRFDPSYRTGGAQ
jgi:hypothetical protein